MMHGVMRELRLQRRPLSAAICALFLAGAVGCDQGAPRPPAPNDGTTPASSATPDATATPAAPAEDPIVYATFVHAGGPVRVRLATREAPRLSMSFILLAEADYFDGRPWTDFSPVVRQTGDSAPVYTVPREFSPKLLFDLGGRLCASNTTEDQTARAKPNRIFITVKGQDRWNLVYSVFGVVEQGLDRMRDMRDGEPIQDVVIEGDTTALRARFASQIPEWKAAIDAATAARQR